MSGCINNNESNNHNHKAIASYTVEIMVNQKDDYLLIIPFPSDNGKYVSNIYDNLKITEGDCKYKIINTSKGLDNFGLKIEFNSNLKINWQDNNNTLYYLSLENRISREDDTWYKNNPIWLLYLNSTQNNSINVYIRYEVDEWSVMNGYLIKDQIINGWNEIIGKKLLRED
jgi:hypothetical protein